MKYDYGRPEQGFSFEHYNFFDCLSRLGHEIIYFDFMTLLQKYGKSWMNRRLLEVAQSEKPALLFTFLAAEELEKETVRKITEHGDIVTLNWFADDHYRFEIFSRFWAPCFTWVVTTAHSTLPKYQQLGIHNVVASQWACNPFVYHRLDLPLKYDVTFVGAPHGNRRAIVQALRDAGLDVQVWGTSWENGRLSQEEMIQVFNQSRINLNFTNAHCQVGHVSPPGKTLKSLAYEAIRSLPLARRIGRNVRDALRRVAPEDTSHALAEQYIPQIKGRTFEIPGCGGFMLTGQAENLDDYFTAGQEVACFNGVEELISKAKYYLTHEEERAAIAGAGYVRCLREHTYIHRFNELFRHIGLPYNEPEHLLQTPPLSGAVPEVA